MNDDKQKGLYHKFTVIRTDGGTLPGRKHEHCEHFVLDLTHDKHAPAAMRAYADSCANDFPRLADDINKMFPRPANKIIDQPAPQDVVEDCTTCGREPCHRKLPEIAIIEMFGLPYTKPAPTTPTVPGWYWVQLKRLKKNLIVEIQECDIKSRVFYYDLHIMALERFENCQFSGPIPLPEGWEK